MLNQEVDQHKKHVLEVLLTYTFIAGIIFSIINFNRHLNTIASIELIAGLLSLWLLYFVKKTFSHNQLLRLSVIYLIMFFAIMLFIFSAKGVSISIFVWVFTIPLISYLMLGSKLGFVFTAVLYSLSALIFYRNLNFDHLMTEKITYGNIFFSALVFWGLSHIYEKTNSEAKSLLKKMAIYDKLTGLYNRSMLSRHVANSLDKAIEERKKIGLISFDLDYFKKINDEFGHAAGDEVLISFSAMLKNELSQQTLAFRLGGEEFALILLLDSIDQATLQAEAIRRKCEKMIFSFHDREISVTVSSGVVVAQPENTDITQLLKMADRRLYLAKNKGRNCVVFEG